MPASSRCHRRRLSLLIAASSVAVALLQFSGCCQRTSAVKPPAAATSTEAPVDNGTGEEPANDAVDGHAPPTDVVAAGDLGQQLYGRHCAACHGADGDGKGLAAAYVFPKPRDFQAGRFRLVSTSNTVPSRDDLHAVLLRGMPGSSMPPWGHLSQAERDALVDEVMRLRREGLRQSYIRILREEEELTDEEIAADDVQEEIQAHVDRLSTPGESTEVPAISRPDDAAVARGLEVYGKFGCASCHGKDGKGDGGQKMFDDEKFPTAPRDFTAGVFKGGHDPASLYRRIAYGMPGTPMPSSQQMTPEQMTDLVHFVRSLSTEEQRTAVVLNREKIVVKSVGELPGDASAGGWTDIAPTSLHMTALWWRDGADPDLQVQAVHDGQTIAVRLSWNDDTPNRHAAQGEAFEDAVAMELYRGDQEPFIGMGDPRAPIDVWFWDADRQTVVDVEDQYPNVVVDIYPFSETSVATAEFQRPGTKLANQPEVSLPALASGNQIVPGHAATGGSDLAGAGPGTSTFRLPKNQVVLASGKWEEGRWNVVMTRPLASPAKDAGIALEPGCTASVAFAVWDGSAQDRDGKKLITIWQDFVLEK